MRALAKCAPGTDWPVMLGKQHDVAECMDNCLFQIETALLRFDDVDSTDKDKASVVKRYVVSLAKGFALVI